MKKKISIFIVLLMVSVICLVGCKVEPSKLGTMVLSYPRVDGIIIHGWSNGFDWDNCVYSGDVVATFNEDGTFTFIYYGETFEGSYKVLDVKDMAATHFEMTFKDGTKTTGECSSSAYGEISYTMKILYNGIEYNLRESEGGELPTTAERIEQEKENLRICDEEGVYRLRDGFSTVYIRGEIVETEDGYDLLIDDEETTVTSDLNSDTFKNNSYYYTLNEDFSFKKIDGVKTGRCILKYGNRFAVYYY